MGIAGLSSGINKPPAYRRPPQSTDTSADMFRIRDDEELGGMGQQMLGKEDEQERNEPQPEQEQLQMNRGRDLRSQQQNGMQMDEQVAEQNQERAKSDVPSTQQGQTQKEPEKTEGQDSKEEMLRKTRETLLDAFLQTGYTTNMTILISTFGAAFPVVAIPLLGILFITFIQVFVGKMILKNKSKLIPGSSYHGLTAPLKIIDPYGFLIYANAIQKFIVVTLIFLVAFGVMALFIAMILSPALILTWGFNELFG